MARRRARSDLGSLRPPSHSPRLAGLGLALPRAQAPPPQGLVHSILSLWSEYFVFQQAAWPALSLGVAVTLSGAQGPEPMAAEALVSSWLSTQLSVQLTSSMRCLVRLQVTYLASIIPLLQLDS